jgi:putative ABC transport system ATP-binding protein
MIELIGVHKTYVLGRTKVPALKGIDLKIGKGDFISVAGPSGSGKTTLLNLIGCLDQPDSGSIMIEGEAVAEAPRNRRAEIRAHKVGFIFQSFNLIPVLNVYENIEFPLFITRKIMSERDRRKHIYRLIEQVGLTEYIKHKPDALSGGQRQRVAIARALVTCPSIVLADEPTANLDSDTAQTILSLMRKLNETAKVTFLFATHDKNIMHYASHVYHLHDGRIADSLI